MHWTQILIASMIRLVPGVSYTGFSSSNEEDADSDEPDDDDQPRFTYEDLEQDIEDRRRDLKEMKSEIRRSWGRYKSSLSKAHESKGIDELEAKAEAKSDKKAAKQRESVYKILWKEYITMRSIKIKKKQNEILNGNTYINNFSDISACSVGDLFEKYDDIIRQREHKINELQAESSSIEDDSVEIDFSDIERDVRELETDDIEFEIEADDGTVHTIEPETDFD